jgi:hypothetical protein
MDEKEIDEIDAATIPITTDTERPVAFVMQRDNRKRHRTGHDPSKEGRALRRGITYHKMDGATEAARSDYKSAKTDAPDLDSSPLDRLLADDGNDSKTPRLEHPPNRTFAIMNDVPKTKDDPFESRPLHPSIVQYWQGLELARLAHPRRLATTELTFTCSFKGSITSTDDAHPLPNSIGLWLPTKPLRDPKHVVALQTTNVAHWPEDLVRSPCMALAHHLCLVAEWRDLLHTINQTGLPVELVRLVADYALSYSFSISQLPTLWPNFLHHSHDCKAEGSDIKFSNASYDPRSRLYSLGFLSAMSTRIALHPTSEKDTSHSTIKGNRTWQGDMSCDAKCATKDGQVLQHPAWFEWELPWAKACGYGRLFIIAWHSHVRWRAPRSSIKKARYYVRSNTHVHWLGILNQGMPHFTGPALLVHIDDHTGQLRPLDRVDFRVLSDFILRFLQSPDNHPRVPGWTWLMPWTPNDWTLDERKQKISQFFYSPPTRSEWGLDPFKTLWLEYRLRLFNVETRHSWRERLALRERPSPLLAVVWPVWATDVPHPSNPDQFAYSFLASILGAEAPKQRDGQNQWKLITYTNSRDLSTTSYLVGTGACFAACKLATVRIGEYTIVLKSVFPTSRHSNPSDAKYTLESTARPHCMEDAMMHAMHHSGGHLPVPNVMASHLAQEPLFGPVLVYGEDPAGYYSIDYDLLTRLFLAQSVRFGQSRFLYTRFSQPANRFQKLVQQHAAVWRALPSVYAQQVAIATLFWHESTRE